MKKILCGAVAAIAVAAASPAAAQTDQTHYAGTAFGGYEFTNPGFIGTFLGELGVLAQVGTRYTAEASAPGNTEDATRTVSVRFRLSGRVQKDCSFYAGNNNDATDIDFGIIRCSDRQQ